MTKNNKSINLFYIPAILLFLFFVVYPFIKGIRLSFTNWNGYSKTFKSVGIKNYITLFKDVNVRRAFINTLVYGFGSALLQNILGVLLAVFLNMKFKGRTIVRTVIYLPVMISPLIMGYIMYFFFNYSRGALNDVLKLFGAMPIDWLASGNRAVFIITLINSLQFCGISMVIYLAGLQNIPTMYYEAAEIDGISGVGKFFKITLPLLTPAVTSAVTLNLIGGLKLFDLVAALTSGGPGYDTNSVSTLINKYYFGGERAGYASAIGIVFFVFIMIVSNVVTKALSCRQVEE